MSLGPTTSPAPATCPSASPSPAPHPTRSFSPEFLARAEAHRTRLAARLGRNVSLEEALDLALDLAASAPRGTGPAVPAKVLFPSRPAGHVEVIVRLAETDELLRRSPEGWRPLNLVERVMRLGEPLGTYRYQDLKAQARQSAKASRSHQVPDRVARFVWLRAGGGCERPGCPRPGAHLHHQVRRAARVTHDPGKVNLLCRACHTALHEGLLAEDPVRGTPTRFRLPGEALASGKTGEERLTDRIDARVHEARQRARSGA